MQESYPFDPALYDEGSPARSGACSYHHGEGGDSGSKCDGEPVVSFQDRKGNWQSGCLVAMEELVERQEITPLGQGA